MDQPFLKREIYVLCYQETSSVCYHQNEEIVGSGKSYKYTKEWVSLKDSFIDSSNFHDKKFDVNERPVGLCSETFTCSSVRVGPYRIDLSDLTKAFGWKKFTELFKYEDPVARVDPDGIWSYEEKTFTLIR